MRLVVDTSVIVKWLSQTNEKNLDQANQLLEAALSGKCELFAPELAKYEIGNVLLLSKLLTPTQANKVLEAFYALPISFICESFSLAKQLKITYYDATFLALAKIYKATLVTENLKHQGKSGRIKVIALQDYE